MLNPTAISTSMTEWPDVTCEFWESRGEVNVYSSDCWGNVIQAVMDTSGSNSAARNNILLIIVSYDNMVSSENDLRAIKRML